MVEYNELLLNAEKSNVNIIENYDFSGTQIKGLYCNGTIALNKRIETEQERKCILAEELGHHYTAVGNILDQSLSSNRKQELHGRIYAYNKLVGLMGIVDAYKNHCISLSETAEHLDVPEDFLKDALNYYKSKYGRYTIVDNYAIFFEPCVAVLEIM